MTKMRQVVCKAMFVPARDSGFTKFGMTPGGGGIAPITVGEPSINQ